MYGGVGEDIYYINGNGDTISDSDANGLVLIGNVALLGGVHQSSDPENVYYSDDGNVQYLLTGTTLVVTNEVTMESVTILNFSQYENDLHIVLSNEPIPAEGQNIYEDQRSWGQSLSYPLE